MSDDLRRKGLGRGLSALLEEDPGDQATMDRLRSSRAVAIEQLEPSPFQPRRYFDEEELRSLVDSIKENGILQPILVRRHPDDPGRYQIVAGERRWRAAQLAALHEVPIVLRELDDSQTLELAIIENIQRQDLTAIEEAEGYKRLMDEFGHTQEALGRIVGKSRSHVANTLRLMNLPEEIRSLVHRGDLTAGHARSLLVADDPVGLAKQVLAQGLNVRQTEQLVQSPQRQKAPRQVKAKDADTVQLEQQLSHKLGLKVVINHKGEAGEVRIAYRSLEQFDDIFHRLTHSRSQPASAEAPRPEPEFAHATVSPQHIEPQRIEPQGNEPQYSEEPAAGTTDVHHGFEEKDAGLASSDPDDLDAALADMGLVEDDDADDGTSDDGMSEHEDEMANLSAIHELDSAVAAIDRMLDDPLPAVDADTVRSPKTRSSEAASSEAEDDDDAFSIYDDEAEDDEPDSNRS